MGIARTHNQQITIPLPYGYDNFLVFFILNSGKHQKSNPKPNKYPTKLTVQNKTNKNLYYHKKT